MVKMATTSSAAIGMAANTTNAPRMTAKPPTSSVSMVDHAITRGADTPGAWRMVAKASGPLAS